MRIIAELTNPLCEGHCTSYLHTPSAVYSGFDDCIRFYMTDSYDLIVFLSKRTVSWSKVADSILTLSPSKVMTAHNAYNVFAFPIACTTGYSLRGETEGSTTGKCREGDSSFARLNLALNLAYVVYSRHVPPMRASELLSHALPHWGRNGRGDGGRYLWHLIASAFDYGYYWLRAIARLCVGVLLLELAQNGLFAHTPRSQVVIRLFDSAMDDRPRWLLMRIAAFARIQSLFLSYHHVRNLRFQLSFDSGPFHGNQPPAQPAHVMLMGAQ
ncbi:hypothetical protein ACRALDRAFT_1095166 [Sodiomyces alcalophilus JCM 7366]|uniref:uncharacterized protein n=1 Tax=Sodiomyces alcalophilus JCM 7366 TaxID=591952 RepID=UPI0039B50691